MSMRSFSSCTVSACAMAGGSAAAAHLIARIHVDASPEAMIPAAVLQVVAVLGGYGQTARAVSHLLGPQVAASSARGQRRGGGRTERGQGCTHPFDAIVTIGTTRLQTEPRGRGGRLISCVFSRSGASCRVAGGRARRS